MTLPANVVPIPPPPLVKSHLKQIKWIVIKGYFNEMSRMVDSLNGDLLISLLVS